MSLDKPPVVSQRASDIGQVHLTHEAAAILARKKTDASERMRRDKIRHEREQRRRQFEHHAQDEPGDDEREDDGPLLDVVA